MLWEEERMQAGESRAESRMGSRRREQTLASSLCGTNGCGQVLDGDFGDEEWQLLGGRHHGRRPANAAAFGTWHWSRPSGLSVLPC